MKDLKISFKTKHNMIHDKNTIPFQHWNRIRLFWSAPDPIFFKVLNRIVIFKKKCRFGLNTQIINLRKIEVFFQYLSTKVIMNFLLHLLILKEKKILIFTGWIRVRRLFCYKRIRFVFRVRSGSGSTLSGSTTLPVDKAVSQHDKYIYI